ncbi:MAG: hypothetical protein ABFS41_17910 [Myxococcota bacterium]
MSAIVGLAMLVFVVSCSAVGIRLLRLANRDGGTAAWLCGHGFCLIAIVGFPLGVLSGNGFAKVGEVALGLAALSLIANCLGITCFFAFTVQVFRPGALWAHALAGAAIAAMAMSAIGIVAAIGTAPSHASSFEVSFGWAATFQWLCALCFGWMGVEGLVEWRRSRKRVALGLSDPVVCNRLLMWGLFGCSTTLLCLVLAAVQHTGQPTATSLAAQLGQALFGLGSSAAVILAFSPPRAIRGRLEERSVAPST